MGSQTARFKYREGKIINDTTGITFKDAILVVDTHEAIDTATGKIMKFEYFDELKERAKREGVAVFVLANRQEGSTCLRLY